MHACASGVGLPAQYCQHFFIDDTPFLQGNEGKHRAAISDWRGTEAALSSHPKRKKETTTGEHGT